MRTRKNLRLLTLAALLILVATPVNYAFNPRAFAAVANNVLGINCAYGASNPAAFPSTITTKDGSGTVDSKCQWTGLADVDGALHPLVSDNPSGLLPGSGGGFTADIIIANLNTSINAFDITLSYDTHVLNAVLIDQSGLTFGGNSGCPATNAQCTITAATFINRETGEVRLAQALLSTTVGPGGSCNTVPPSPTNPTGNPNCILPTQTLFRIRFDVVGAGTGAISFTSHTIANPAAVRHTSQDGALSTDALFSLINKQTTVGSFILFWSISPSPEVPGSPLTFSAVAGCVYCTGTLSYAWDFNSTDSPTYVAKISATGSTVTVTAPPPVINRVTVTAFDTAGHIAKATRVLPLTAVDPPAIASTGAATAPFTAKWLGGVVTTSSGYSGSWRFCPGSTFVTAICTTPFVPFTQNPGAITQTITSGPITFNFAGTYNAEFKVSDTPVSQIPTANTVTVPVPVSVTGGTPAFAVTVTCNCTKTVEAGPAIRFSANATYAPTYPLQFRSSTFSYTFSFGDGSSTTIANVASGMFATTYHTYVDPGNFTTTVVATETGSNTPSHIQESGLSAVTSVFDYALSVSPSRLPPVPAGVFSSTTATVTATVTAGTTQRIDLAACKGVCTDGNAFFKGIIVSFKPSFGSPPFTSIMTINVTATAPPGVYDITIGGSSNLVPERDTDIIIQVGALAANFGPTTTTVGVTNFVSKIVGGLKPFSCTWDFGDGSGSQTGCNPAHTYTASGNFTATLVVTDSDTPATTVTVTHFVVVEPNPRLVGRGIIAKAFISFGATELLKANVDNPSDFSEAVTVSIDIFRGPGIFVTRLSATVILGPVNSTQIVLTFTPATPGTYSFQAVLTYTTLVPVPPTNGATTPAVLGSTIVSGTGGTRSGTFTSG